MRILGNWGIRIGKLGNWGIGDLLSLKPNHPTSKTQSPIYLITLFVLFIFTIASTAQAATINAASCEYEDVQAAVDAAQSGDTVLVPAGPAAWSGCLRITKGITLKGMGEQNTIITSNHDASNPATTFDAGNFLIIYEPDPYKNEPFRITGFTIDLNNKCGGIMLKNYTAIKINQIRIDHNVIKNATNPNGTMRAIMIYGTVYGVIDHNKFSGNQGNITSYGANKASWDNLKLEFGSADFMFYEDNDFTITDTAHAGGQGGRYCARYNNYTYTATDAGLYPWFDIHGNQGQAGNYSTMGAEIYGNRIAVDSNLGGWVFNHRGGKALIFNNKVVSSALWRAVAKEEYDDILNPTTNIEQPQHVSDSYYWNNRYGRPDAVNLISAFTKNITGVAYPVTENVDFYQDASPFDGTVGVGCGPLSARPESCNVGVGYWATEQDYLQITDANVGVNQAEPIRGTLYQCTAPDTWTKYYEPYTYPHPLTLEGDVNSDTYVDINDAVRAVELALDDSLGTPEERARADLDGDGLVTVNDVVQIVEIILSAP